MWRPGSWSGSAVRRRRECHACGRRYTTFERVEDVGLWVLKRDGTREQYDREKLTLGVRKAIKNLHLAVLPPNGRVRVSAPLSMKDDAIRTLLATKLPWIKKQQAKFASQERQTPREYISGESHYFLGKRYRLEVIYQNLPARVEQVGKNKLVASVRGHEAQRLTIS